VTKSVNFVRSPVRNPQNFVPDVAHRKFVDAVAGEFMRGYGDGNRVCFSICCSPESDHKKFQAQVKFVHEADYVFNDVIRNGLRELQVWCCPHESMAHIFGEWSL